MASQNAHFATRLIVRGQLRKQGYGRDDINFMLDGLDDNMIDAASTATGTDAGLASTESGASSGTGTGVFAQILQALMTFLESPQGQALIAALIQMLIASLGHSKCLC